MTLSHHHARLFLLPAPAVWLRQAEMQPWLAAQLAPALGGGAAGEWRFAWDLTPPGQPILVAALEARMLDDLGALLARRGLALAGARPWLAAAWNRRRQLAGATGWYALLEPGRITLLRLERGRPRLLRQRQAGEGDPAGELRALLARESLMEGIAEGGNLWLERAGVASGWAGLGGSHSVHELAGPADPALALLQ